MNFGLAQSMVRRPRVLRGGKAPVYWKRELSELTQGLASMPPKCEWVREIAETQPRLLSGPLLGTSLTAVTSNAIARSDSNDDESPANRLTPPHLSGNRSKAHAFDATASSKRRQVHSLAVTNQRSENAAHLVDAWHVPRRAPESLLRRAVPEGLHVTENLIRATASLPRSGPSSPPVTSFQEATRLEWLRLVADRAARRWASDWIFPSTRKYSSPAIAQGANEQSHAPAVITQSQVLAAPTPATVEPIFHSPLEDNWLLPISGQQASPQLLASLVKRPGTAHATPQKIDRSKQTSGGIESNTRSFPPGPDPTSQRSDRLELSSPLESVFRKQSPAPPADIDRTDPFSLETTFNPEEREQRASRNLAPTVLTPALSPLLPPLSAGAPVSPVAADTARRIAWRDEVEAHETDLSVLAAQVKRILDEEARRHGIDV